MTDKVLAAVQVGDRQLELQEFPRPVIGPEEGLLSCGYEGLGRLWPVDEVAGRALELLV